MQIRATIEKINQLRRSQKALRAAREQSYEYRHYRSNRLPGIARKAGAYFIAHPELCGRAA
jgi:hypothetical protein